ncbi:hypothetical protein Scep_014983 [Stephania cephalantha]|uniref:Uncharacterized protein n=2 Tax=Stephania TaxID=147243 RepID=A0AAP0J4F3_9MAGN
MNPLTLVKRIQKINSKEAELGISEQASWHSKYKDSAYVFVGGVPFDLTEGDLLAVFAQYGEIVDVNLVRDKGTGKSKGFAFIAYEDQRSTNLAVDNLNGASVLGRIIRVDHVSKYKKKEEEDEEEEQRKKEERGVCRAFQRGECNRGAACKFSHNEQHAKLYAIAFPLSCAGIDEDGPREGFHAAGGARFILRLPCSSRERESPSPPHLRARCLKGGGAQRRDGAGGPLPGRQGAATPLPAATERLVWYGRGGRVPLLSCYLMGGVPCDAPLVLATPSPVMATTISSLAAPNDIVFHKRGANTGWGAKDEVPRWKNDKYDGPSKKQKSIHDTSLDDKHNSFFKGENSRVKLDNEDARTSRAEDREAWPKRSEKDPREEERKDIKRRYGNKESHVEDWDKRETKRKLEKYERDQNTKEDRDRKGREDRSARHELERNKKEDDSRRGWKERLGRHESEPNSKDHKRRGREEKSDRHDTELNSKSYDSGAREEKTDGKYSQKNPQDDRDLRNNKHLRHDRDSSSRHRRGEADQQRSYK